VPNLELELNSAPPLRFAIVLCCLLLIGAPPVRAAEQTAAPEDETATQQAAEAGDESGRPEAKSADDDATPPAGKTSDVFIPTEEISEDFAVSFPVDI